MTRHGRYYEVKRLILEYLVASTDGGICPRPVILSKLKIKKSSATDILCSMEKAGLIRIAKRTFDNVQSIEITNKGRALYAESQVKNAKMPMVVRRYLAERKIKAEGLFAIQKDFVDRGLVDSQKNVCIFGYPGSGKTLNAEIAIASEIDRGGRVLYCTPYKALDWQKFTEFQNSFKMFDGIKILIADGDSPVSNDSLAEASIIIATYERIIGAIQSKEKWIDGITLVCADEITLLDDEDRGGTIDTVLTHLRGDGKKSRRIITISSLVENTTEIARWLDAELVIENRPAFDGPINECIIYQEADKIVKWHKSGRKEVIEGKDPLNMIIKGNLEAGRTTIVFVGMRDFTRCLAKDLAKLHKQDSKLEAEARAFLKCLKEKSVQMKELCEMIPYGIAYHHAGLQRKARRFIEDLIRRGLLKTVVATTTLSHGVDYKIDSVVIIPSPIGILRDLKIFDYINLKGRAGRPGKSAGADIYLLCGPKGAQSNFMKYFSSAPEPIHSNATVSESNLSSLMLSYQYPELDLEQLTGFVSRTFCCSGEQARFSDLKQVADKLAGRGLLAKSHGKFVITGLGLRANKANLSAEDALIVLASGTDTDSLLKTAMQIDVIRRMKLGGALIDNGLAIIKAWVDGQPLDAIRKSTSERLYDQDLLDFVSYTSLSLRKMAIFFEDDDRVRKRVTDLQEKIYKRLRT